MMLRSLAISLALFASLPAAAQDCAELHAPWAQAGQVVSATDPAGFAAARIEAGQAVLLDLHPDGEVAYRSLPQGEGEAASSGGMAVIAIAQPGIFLSQPPIATNPSNPSAATTVSIESAMTSRETRE